MKKKILIEEDFFEHLLSCLANQKFVNELPPNGDAVSSGKEVYYAIQKRNQKIIDEAWMKGMDLLKLKKKS